MTQASRACTKCGVVQELDAFYPDRSKRDGHHTVCKECVKAARRTRYASDPEYRARSHAAALAWHRRNAGAKSAARQVLRREMIAAYGGCCECCGETAPEFLTMDHFGGWGAAHRAQDSNAGAKLPFLLKKLGWPKDGFRLLCWNCNCARGIYGFCPHGQLI